MNVINLAEKTDNASFISVADLLRATAIEIDNGKIKADKCLLLFVDTSSGKFSLSFRNAQMKASQMIAACEVMNGRCLAMMGIVHGPDSD